jgi:glycosyltransferase involved in cell wall biosynthesis
MKTIPENPTVLIFHRNLLPKSETFVVAQAKNLRRYNPYYAGVQRTGGLDLPPDRTCALAGSGWYGAAAARWYKLTGVAPRFEARVKRVAPTLIHAHFEESGLAALPLARNLDLPLITTFHGFDATASEARTGPRRLLAQIYRRQRKRLQSEGSLFVAVSEFIRTKLLERGYPAERTVTVPIGVDVDLFNPQREEAAVPTVLFVGRMVEKKGVTYLLDAMAEVMKICKNARLVLIGDGPLMPALIDQACALKLPNVTFMGSCDPAMVRQQMSRASILAAPSVTAASGDSEGLPIVVCEAQATGLPVVGTRHAGIPEIVQHDKTGLLVAERSIHELAQSILILLGRPELRRQMGSSARMNVCLNYNLKILTARLENHYDGAIRQHARSGQAMERTVATGAGHEAKEREVALARAFSPHENPVRFSNEAIELVVAPKPAASLVGRARPAA